MYRQQQNNAATLVVVILIGLAAGVGYLLYDRGLLAPQTIIIPITTPAPTAVSELPAAAITPTAAPQNPREITFGARFYAPTAGIAGEIVETYLDGTSWDVSELGPNVGHLQGTAWLNAPGNIVLAGHVEMADGRAGIFAVLDRLQIGDPITLSQNGEERTYQVTQKFTTHPTDLSVMYPAENERLTLITCSAYDFLQDAYLERFVVVAERVA